MSGNKACPSRLARVPLCTEPRLQFARSQNVDMILPDCLRNAVDPGIDDGKKAVVCCFCWQLENSVLFSGSGISDTNSRAGPQFSCAALRWGTCHGLVDSFPQHLQAPGFTSPPLPEIKVVWYAVLIAFEIELLRNFCPTRSLISFQRRCRQPCHCQLLAAARQ